MRLYHIIHKHCIIIQTDTTRINVKLAFTAHYAGGGCTTWLCVYSGHIAYKSHAKCHIIPRATLCTTTSLSRSRKHGYSFMCGTASLFKPAGCTPYRVYRHALPGRCYLQETVGLLEMVRTIDWCILIPAGTKLVEVCTGGVLLVCARQASYWCWS